MPSWPGRTSISTPGGQCQSRWLCHLRHDVCRVLVGHEAEGEFHEGLGGKHGFRTLALIAAADAVDLGGRPRPDTLGRRVTGLAEQAGGSGHLQEIRIAHAGDLRPHLRAPSLPTGGPGRRIRRSPPGRPACAGWPPGGRWRRRGWPPHRRTARSGGRPSGRAGSPRSRRCRAGRSRGWARRARPCRYRKWRSRRSAGRRDDGAGTAARFGLPISSSPSNRKIKFTGSSPVFAQRLLDA